MTLVANRQVLLNAGSKVVQIEQLWKELINGTFDLTIPFCHVAQRLADPPIIKQGAGFVAPFTVLVFDRFIRSAMETEA